MRVAEYAHGILHDSAQINAACAYGMLPNQRYECAYGIQRALRYIDYSLREAKGV